MKFELLGEYRVRDRFYECGCFEILLGFQGLRCDCGMLLKSRGRDICGMFILKMFSVSNDSDLRVETLQSV
jgi:hypothetical protein